MLGITILCVGTLKESYLRAALDEYKKRLNGLCKFNIVEIGEERLPDNPYDSQIEAALNKEGEKILKRIPNSSKIITMCIEGCQQSSEELAASLEKYAVSGVSNICFIIGGSFGLSESVKVKSDFKLSMSKMTFPHQLARVMLAEQLYRAFKINQNSKYHK